MNTDKITRVEVIDENGRSYTKYGVTDVQLILQDDERTLKIFLTVPEKVNTYIEKEDYRE
jgi:hypothetical protein